MTKDKGITLIAIIITIIILLILAFVSIYITTHISITEKADKSANKYNIEQAKEELTVALSSMIIDNSNIMSENNYTIEQAFETELSTDITTFLPYCNESEYYLIYKEYLWKINRDSKEIEYVSDAPVEYTGDGTILDGLEITDQINKAKSTDYVLTVKNVDGASGLVYSDYNSISEIDTDNNNEAVWNVSVKLASEAYCDNNILAYDGSTALYVPVMVRFYRENKYTTWSWGTEAKSRGLNSFIVSSPTNYFSTNNSNNEWAFVDNNSYNYEATSDRKCTSNTTSSTSFKDTTSGHYYAFGRITYTDTPKEILTNIGSFEATSYDQDNNSYSFKVGSNYVIDVREYYETIKNAQELLGSIENTSNITTEIHNLSVAVVTAIQANNDALSSSTDVTISNRAENLENNIKYYTAYINSKIDELKTAQELQEAQVSDEVLAIINSAKDIDYTISTIDYTGSSQLVSCDNTELINKNSVEQTWKVSSVKLAAEIYCNDNIMIYNGSTSPYVPVMVRFYRSNDYTSTRDRGLNYFNVTGPTSMQFSTNNSNNDWAFVSDSSYNYETSSSRMCSSSTSGTSFKDKTNGHYYAFGRLTYTGSKPSSTLTNLGSFEATACDQDGNKYSFSTGSNYLVDVSEYCELMDKAKSLSTVENVLKDSDATLKLANLIIEYAQTEFTYSNAETFANEVDQRISNLTSAIEDIK